MLIVMSGLPGAGKSTLAEALGREIGVPVLSVDPVEAAMWRAGVGREQPTGLAAYVVVEALAEEMLRLGLSVIVDAVNDAEPARQQWRDLASRQDAVLRWVEVVCSDRESHRRRVENRREKPVGWASVEARRAGFAGWGDERLVVEAADRGNLEKLLAYVRDA